MSRLLSTGFPVFVVCTLFTLAAPFAPFAPFASADQLNHQERIVEGVVNCHGDGYFKFALVDGTNPPQVYWSNNGSINGQTTNAEPSAAVQLTVTRGLYSVVLGDATIANMTDIPGQRVPQCGRALAAVVRQCGGRPVRVARA
jgi:hypothetical protein